MLQGRNTASIGSRLCTASIGSMTSAMKAQRLLFAAAIHSSVVKLSAASARRGCAYGISFPCAQQSNVRTILERAGVRVKSITEQ